MSYAVTLTTLRKAGNTVKVDERDDGDVIVTVRRGTAHKGERPSVAVALHRERDEPDDEFDARLAEAAEQALEDADRHAKMRALVEKHA
jgi:hypothetical protein